MREGLATRERRMKNEPPFNFKAWRASGESPMRKPTADWVQEGAEAEEDEGGGGGFRVAEVLVGAEVRGPFIQLLEQCFRGIV